MTPLQPYSLISDTPELQQLQTLIDDIIMLNMSMKSTVSEDMKLKKLRLTVDYNLLRKQYHEASKDDLTQKKDEYLPCYM